MPHKAASSEPPAPVGEQIISLSKARPNTPAWNSAFFVWAIREIKIPCSFHYNVDASVPKLLTAAIGRCKLTRYIKTPVRDFTEGEVGSSITSMIPTGMVEDKQIVRIRLAQPREQRLYGQPRLGRRPLLPKP